MFKPSKALIKHMSSLWISYRTVITFFHFLLLLTGGLRSYIPTNFVVIIFTFSVIPVFCWKLRIVFLILFNVRNGRLPHSGSLEEDCSWDYLRIKDYNFTLNYENHFPFASFPLRTTSRGSLISTSYASFIYATWFKIHSSITMNSHLILLSLHVQVLFKTWLYIVIMHVYDFLLIHARIRVYEDALHILYLLQFFFYFSFI